MAACAIERNGAEFKEGACYGLMGLNFQCLKHKFQVRDATAIVPASMDHIETAKDVTRPGSLLLAKAYGHLVWISSSNPAELLQTTLFPKAYLEEGQFPVTSVGLVLVLPCWTLMRKE
jgi:hypothetical protein